MSNKEIEKNVDQAGLTYSASGVDIDKANLAKKGIKALARSTFNANVISEIGAFAGFYRADFPGMEKPVLVSSADGVGTKLKIAFMMDLHNTVGIDIVSHCTNDILVHGAVPIFFLDYIATGKLEPRVVVEIVEGLAEGCKQAGCALLGGETAEMPDFYQAGEYDLAGFIVGIADQDKIYQGNRVREGDVLIGLPSSGLHTNGYSLARKLFFDREKMGVHTHVAELGRTVGEELLAPHRNYLPTIREFLANDQLSAIAHITGGGITENLDRALPSNLDAKVNRGSWDVLPVFQFIGERGKVAQDEMYRTFNMGIGMILVVPDNQADAVCCRLEERGEKYYRIGEIIPGSGKVVY